jgi:hypothetical protein
MLDYKFPLGGKPRPGMLLREFRNILVRMQPVLGPDSRLFGLGYHNGSLNAEISKAGYQVAGLDPSPAGIKLARKAFP